MDEPVTFIDKPGPAATAPGTDPATGAPASDGAPASASGDGMRAELEAAIEAIRPALQMDGGDVSLVGVDEATGVVEIELVGACVGCPASTMTLKAGIERILKDRVEGVTEVNAVGLEPAFDY